MIARNLENKRVGFQVETNVSHNSPIGGADCEPLVGEIVPIDTTTGQNSSTQRMGDRIKPKRLTVKGIVSFKPTTCTTQQDIYVRVIIASQKSIKVGSQVLAGSVDTNRLLRPGFATDDQVPFAGETEELNYPINKDLFRVYMDKVYKLNVGTAGSVEAFPRYSKRWSYTFKEKNLPQSLTFDEGNGNWANNFAPFVAVGYAYSDGSSPETLTTRITSSTVSFLDFEDA